ncbi:MULTISPECIES: saccharopine dehydrogenase NADP-binding domain-containing protein [Rhodomicrobium]|uniref:saccharopine dehydrogenase family protein n=1 Tax=Rhodomicrobium TaxID=1068 RepID=UPI001AECF758|nr:MULTISPECIES: saccharopine dehydrogenase NADP-binding domain-containing protein [Rhodomicrobium]
MDDDIQLDLVVFGGTSFVGQILCRRLAATFGVDGPLRWGAAGRSHRKLQDLRASLGPHAADLHLIVADATDEEALRQLCESTKVVVSTVGPFALYGETLVKVCAETGTDYCDLAAEVHWIRRMIDSYEPAAKASGARIVHGCGFDSIPSDLGVHFLQRHAEERFGRPCSQVKMRVKALRGKASGGSVASLMNVTAEAARNRALRRELANPYALTPREEAPETRQPSLSGVKFDHDFGGWTAPYVMAGTNTRIVHRTNALSDFAYGEDFVYDEAVLTGRGVRGRLAAFVMASALRSFLIATALRPTRWLLKRYMVPAPGEGPSPEAQKNGFYDLRFLGTGDDGEVLRAKLVGAGDPGYASTSKILAHTGALLALDLPKSEKPGGFWTPATLFGDRLIDLLHNRAGLKFELLPG